MVCHSVRINPDIIISIFHGAQETPHSDLLNQTTILRCLLDVCFHNQYRYSSNTVARTKRSQYIDCEYKFLWHKKIDIYL